MKKLLLGIFVLLTSVAFAQTENLPVDTINGRAVYRYKVQKSEGLFRISQNFGVTQDDIIRFNPILQTEGIKLGQTLLIPVVEKIDSAQYTIHCLAAKETLYSLSRTYGVTVDEIKTLNPETSKTMQIGQCLLIKKNGNAPIAPKPQEEPTAKPVIMPKDTSVRKQESNLPIKRPLLVDSTAHKAKATTEKVLTVVDSTRANIVKEMENILPETAVSAIPLRIAYMMPFFTDAPKRDASMDRFIDFYEGSLIAIYEAQLLGQKFDIYAYDTRKEDIAIQRILQKPELQNIDAIIGPAYPAQVTYAAAFAKQNRIPLLVPFTSKVSGLDTNPYIWQFNPSVDTEAAAIINHLMPQKEQVQLFFVEPTAASTPQSVQAIYQAANDSGFNIISTTISTITKDSVESLLDAEKKNIFVFNSEKYSAVQVLIPNVFKLSGKYNIAMIGQYSWSTSETALPMIYATVFHEVDPIKEAHYRHLYERYFGHELSSTHPRYDLLGYDLTTYVIRSLVRSQQAINEEQKDNILRNKISGLSTDISLEHINAAGGYLNKGLQVVETK